MQQAECIGHLPEHIKLQLLKRFENTNEKHAGFDFHNFSHYLATSYY